MKQKKQNLLKSQGNFSNSKLKIRQLKYFVYSSLLVGLIYLIFSQTVNADKYIEPRESAVLTTDINDLEGIKTKDLVKDFGAKPNDSKDDSAALIAALKEAKKEPLKLTIPKGEYLSTGAVNVEATDIKGLYIQGDGAVFKPKNPMINPPENYFLKLYLAKDNVGVKIEGITIDGSLNPQDLFFTLEKQSEIYELPLQRGILISGAEEIVVTDTEFKNMYGGYGLLIEHYKNVNISNLTFDNVGGDDITDSFGMALYFGGHEGDAEINIDEVHSNGMLSEKDPTYTAWIGVVLENGSIQSQDRDQWVLDKNTTVNITNSTFNNYETTFHVESMAGNVYWNADNIETTAKDYFIMAGVNGEFRERSNRINMKMTPWGRNDVVHGLYYTEKERDDNISGNNKFSMYNSKIEYLTIDGKSVPVATSYGDSVKAKYVGTSFMNVPSKLVTNASGEFINSIINLDINSTETAESLLKGPFSEPNVQFVKFKGKTKVTKGTDDVTKGTLDPKWYVPSGREAPELKEPMGHAEISN